MLKTTCKQARQNISTYIMNNFDGSNYDIETPATFQEAAAIILDTVKAERPNLCYYGIVTQAAFFDWCQGLPSLLDTCYYYNRSAVADLAAILEETEQEASRFTESQAEQQLTWLLYREITAAVRK